MKINIMCINAARQHALRKLFLIMKLATLLIIIMVFTVRASTFAQKVTLNEQQASLEKVLEKIRMQSGYDFLYNYAALDKAEPVTINIHGVTLEQALQMVLAGQPLIYEIENKTVLIKEKTVVESTGTSNAQDITVTGIIYNEDNRPMVGATIRVKGTNKYVTTNAWGLFTLKAPEKAILQISFIGYETQEITAAASIGVIKMKVSESVLDEVQVRQYGQTTNRNATGSAITIKGKDLAQSPSPNILTALAGRVPGLTITQNGSNASANFAVTIRGASSLGADPYDNLNFRNQPLFILDGFPLAQGTGAQTASGQNITGMFAGGGTAQTSSPNTAGLSLLYSINPNDVESVTVLKDADATAIYGSQGANGVILITTKKAKPGKMSVDGSVNYGNSYQIKKLDLMNTQQYLDMRSKAISLDSAANPTVTTNYRHTAAFFPEYFLFDRNRDVDWQKQLLGSKPNVTANLGFSSGTELTSVRTNFSYFKNMENIPNAPSSLVDGYHETRGTGMIGINARTANNNFRLNSALSFATSSSDLSSANLENLIYLPPNAPDLFTPTGALNFAGWRVLPPTTSAGTLVSAYPTSVLNLLRPFQTNMYTGNANLEMQYDVFKGLTLFARGSYNFQTMNLWSVTSNGASIDPTVTTGLVRAANFADQKLQTYNAEGGIGYTKQLDKHKITASLGSRYQVNQQRFSFLQGLGYVSDLTMRSLSAASSYTVAGSAGDITESRLLSGYLTLGYSYADRYLLNINGRRDGSSDYSYNSYSNFGSLSGAWIFSDEPWLKVLKAGNIFSFGKLRGSLGRSGEPVSIPNLALADFVSGGSFAGRYQGVSALTIARTANADVHSPTKTSSEYGLDLGFLSDKLTLSVTHYVSRTRDMIMTSPTTSVAVGTLTLPYNLPGVIKSYGWEGSLMYRSNLGKDLRYSVGLNVSRGDNILESFPNIANSVYNQVYTVGQSINRTMIYQITGINNQGLYYWDGGNSISGSTPRFTYIPTAPKYAGGIQASVSYKNFTLGTNWNFQRKNAFAGLLTNGAPGTLMQNQLARVIGQSWQQPGDEATAIYQRYTTGASNLVAANYLAGASNLFLKDITYLGLKNARLDYQLPNSLLAKLKITRFGVFASGDNLFYITNYKGLNPEDPSSSLFVIRRNVNLGLNVTF